MSNIENYLNSGFFGRLYYRFQMWIDGEDLEKEIINHQKKVLWGALKNVHHDPDVKATPIKDMQKMAKEIPTKEFPHAIGKCPVVSEASKEDSSDELDEWINTTVASAIATSVLESASDSGSDAADAFAFGGGDDFSGGGAGGDW